MTLNLREEPGWVGWFTRDQVKGAIPSGTRIQKVVTEAGDARPVGATGTVLGSLASPEPIKGYEHVKCTYFVEWDDRPRVAVAVVDYKIQPLLQA